MKTKWLFILLAFNTLLLSCAERNEIKEKVLKMYENAPKVDWTNSKALDDLVSQTPAFNDQCEETVKNDPLLLKFFNDLIKGEQVEGRPVTIEDLNFSSPDVRDELDKKLNCTKEERKILFTGLGLD